MSFPLICPSCGAPSGPSVGVCPYCKTTLTPPSKHSHNVADLQKLYSEGKLNMCLPIADQLYREKAEIRQDLEFMILFVKMLLDAEAPSSRARSVLVDAFVHHPRNPELLNYIEIIEARLMLKMGLNDAGEMMLRNVIRRDPQNYHACFILGTHLFWVEKRPEMAVALLEQCTRLQPFSLRSWGCLGAIYQQTGHASHAARAFQKAMELEVEPRMKEFFKAQIEGKKAS